MIHNKLVYEILVNFPTINILFKFIVVVAKTFIQEWYVSVPIYLFFQMLLFFFIFK